MAEDSVLKHVGLEVLLPNGVTETWVGRGYEYTEDGTLKILAENHVPIVLYAPNTWIRVSVAQAKEV